MITIDSVDLYLSRTSNRTGWYIHLDMHTISDYTNDPTVGSILGSTTPVLVDTVPVTGSPGWVTFTFSTPITITADGFYGIHVWGDTTSYQMSGLLWYGASDWSDATGGTPFAGKECAWERDSDGSWTAGNTRAYRLNCTGCDDNVAETPTGTSYTSTGGGITYGQGVRSYLAVLPAKPTNPTPESGGSGVTLHATTGSWENGGGATAYDIYYGTLSGFLSLVAEDVTETEAELITGNFPLYGEIYYWRVDAKNEAGTTQGDEWNFTTIVFLPPVSYGGVDEDGDGYGDDGGIEGYDFATRKRLVCTAGNTFFYEEL